MTNLQSSDNVNYLSPEKFNEIREYIKTKLPCRKLKPEDVIMIFEIAYAAGLRVNEVLKLKPKDFDFNLLEINLGKTKTEQRGLASFSEKFGHILKDYFEDKNPHSLLFPISRQTAYQWLMQIGKDCKVSALITPQSETREKTKTHLFRKSVGKDMLYKKAPLNIIQRKLRHNNINTTSEYLKIKLNDVKNWEKDNF